MGVAGFEPVTTLSSDKLANQCATHFQVITDVTTPKFIIILYNPFFEPEEKVLKKKSQQKKSK